MSNNVSAPILSEAVNCGGLYYLSGQIGTSPETGALAGDTIEAQAAQAARNIEAVLKKNGLSMSDILRANCYLTDMDNYGRFNAVYAEHFTGLPARTCIAVKALPYGALCEIEVIASRRGG